jgi:cyclohexyl-isocyanide hydratase
MPTNSHPSPHRKTQIRTEHGLRLIADVDLDTCPDDLDLLLVPGGPGQLPLMEDERVLRFIRQRAASPRLRYLTSVCTGALVLAATGLLARPQPDTPKVRATTHWLFTPLLEALGCEVGSGRVVWDEVETRVRGEGEGDEDVMHDVSFTLATGGGITAGIDFALDIVGRLYGVEAAQAIQLGTEYDPRPPRYDAITAAVDERVKADAAGLLERRRAAVDRIRQRLGLGLGLGLGLDR